MTSVLLIHLGFPPKSQRLLDLVFFRYYRGIDKPLGIGYLSSSLTYNNIENDILDLQTVKQSRKENLIAKKVKGKDFVGLSFHTQGVPDALRYAKLIKQVNPEAKIVFGGPHVTFDYIRMLKYEEVDYCVLGEGEHALVSLIKNGPEKTAGVAFRKNKSVKHSKPVFIKNIDDLPFPERDKFKSVDYKYGSHVCVLSSRGCPMQCVFCVESKLFKTCRFRKARLVGEELEQLYDKGARVLHFSDSNFTVNKKHLASVCEEIVERKLFFDRVHVRVSIEHMDYERLKILKRAGVKYLGFGIESLSPEVIDFVRKTRRPFQYGRKALKMLYKANRMGFVVGSSYVLGLPHQTTGGVLSDFNLLKKAGSWISPTFLTPIPGTIFYNENYTIDALSKMSMEDLVLNYSKASDSELRGLYEKVRSPYGTYLKNFLKRLRG